MKKILFAFILLMFLGMQLFGLEGQIVDAKTEQPLAACLVQHTPSSNVVFSDSKGYFQMEGVTNGYLIVQRSGYADYRISVSKMLAENPLIRLVAETGRERDSGADDARERDDQKADESAGAEEEEDEADRDATAEKKVRLQKLRVESRKKERPSMRKIGKEEIQGATQPLFADTYKVIQTLPGVSSANSMSAEMYVRGGSFYEAIAVMDDIFLLNPYMWGGQTSVFNPNIIESVEFSSGGYQAEYGQAMSGVLDVELITGNTTNVGGLIELSSATFEGVIHGPLGDDGRSSWMLSARRTYYDLIFPPDMLFGQEGDTLPFFYDAHSKFVIGVGEKSSLDINTLVTYDGMDMTYQDEDEEEEPTAFEYDNLQILQGLRFRSPLTDQLNSRSSIAYRYVDGEFNGDSVTTPWSASSELHELQLRSDLNWTPSKKVEFETGVAIMTAWQTMNLDMTVKELILQEDTTNAIYFETNMQLEYEGDNWFYGSAYLSSELQPVDWLTLFVGGRLEYLDLTESLNFSPRFAMQLDLNEKTRLKMATGLYQQYPFYVYNGGALDDTYGNPDLSTEKAVHYVLGVERDFPADIEVRLEGFYKDYDDMVTQDPEENYLNSGDRRAWGFDLYVKKNIGDWIDGWIAYSYIKTEDIVLERRDPAAYGKPRYETPLDEWYAPSHDRPHNLSLVLNIHFSAEWKLALTFKYASGAPYTPLKGVEEYNDLATGKTVYEPVWGEYNSERLPAYHTLDVKLTMPFFGLDGFSSYFQLINSYNHKNVQDYYYNASYSERKEMKDMPFMFIGGFKFQF